MSPRVLRHLVFSYIMLIFRKRRCSVLFHILSFFFVPDRYRKWQVANKQADGVNLFKQRQDFTLGVSRQGKRHAVKHEVFSSHLDGSDSRPIMAHE